MQRIAKISALCLMLCACSKGAPQSQESTTSQGEAPRLAASTGEVACTADEATRISDFIQRTLAAEMSITEPGVAAALMEDGKAVERSLSRSCYEFWARAMRSSQQAQAFPKFPGRTVLYDQTSDGYTIPGVVACPQSGCVALAD